MSVPVEGLVLDASAILNMMLSEPGGPAVCRLIERSLQTGSPNLAAPDLIHAECANGLAKAVKRGALEKAEAKEALGHLRFLNWTLLPSMMLLERTFDHALLLGLSAYDAFYYAAAEQLGYDLVTEDQDLIRKTRPGKVRVISIKDLVIQ